MSDTEDDIRNERRHLHAPAKPSSVQPRWFTPLRLLGIFCVTNLFVYLDRGLIASNGVNGSPPSDAEPEGSGIQGAFKLTYFQDGLLPAAFMVGLLISSPIFAEASKTANPFWLLAIGMGIWSVACLGCAASTNFVMLLLCRALVGVGEASFVSLAAPFIDDYAPVSAKSRWFAAFYLCIPVGFALGYIVGGLVTQLVSWRWAFVLEALAMLPFVVFVATAEPLRLKGAGNKGQGVGSSLQGFGTDVRRVVSLPVWLFLCIGYTLNVAVLGVFAYWGPQAGRQLFFGTGDAASSGQADLAFGGVTVITGVFGTLAGGVLLDRMGSSLRSANLVCAVSQLLSFVGFVTAFTATKSFAAFLSVFGIGQLILFCSQAPVAAISMWCVPPALRPLGVSLLTVSIHLLGDVPSPPLLGLLQSKLSQGMSERDAAEQWRVSMSIISILLVASGTAFGWGAYISTPARDFRLLSDPDISQRGQTEDGKSVENKEAGTKFSPDGGVESQPLLN